MRATAFLVFFACLATQAFAAIYWGAFVPYAPNDLTNFENDANRKVSLNHFFQQWGNSDNALDVNQLTFTRNRGVIPVVTWEPWIPNGNVNQPDYSLASIINGNHDTYIKSWADAAKNWGHPFFLRFAHEMNGNWYPWSERVNGNQPGQYKAAFQHVFNIFQAQGAKQVTFIWCPNNVDPTTTPYSELYPGDNYVHWVGVDGYNWGKSQSWSSWTSFQNIFQQSYNQLTGYNKPIIIVEDASTENGGNKAQWITDALTTQLPKTFPAVKGFVWFNIQKETDWLIESSAASKQAFASGINSGYYTTNSFGNITGLIRPA